MVRRAAALMRSLVPELSPDALRRPGLAADLPRPQDSGAGGELQCRCSRRDAAFSHLSASLMQCHCRFPTRTSIKHMNYLGRHVALPQEIGRAAALLVQCRRARLAGDAAHGSGAAGSAGQHAGGIAGGAQHRRLRRRRRHRGAALGHPAGALWSAIASFLPGETKITDVGHAQQTQSTELVSHHRKTAVFAHQSRHAVTMPARRRLSRRPPTASAADAGGDRAAAGRRATAAGGVPAAGGGHARRGAGGAAPHSAGLRHLRLRGAIFPYFCRPSSDTFTYSVCTRPHLGRCCSWRQRTSGMSAPLVPCVCCGPVHLGGSVFTCAAGGADSRGCRARVCCAI